MSDELNTGQQFIHKLSNGDELRTGLIAPDSIPSTYASYPPARMLDLRDIKLLYRVGGRKPIWDIYKRRKQQGRKSSCAAYAGTTGCEVKRKIDFKADVEFGPEYLYCHVNGGQDHGATLGSIMREMLKTGCCLRDSVPYQIHTFQGSMNMEQKRFADQEAKQYRAMDWKKMPHGTPDECWQATLSAIAQRDPVLMAVHCGDGFFSADGQGNARPDRGPGNHAVCGAELVGVETAQSLRDIKIWTINSHGKQYGANGTYLHTYDHMIGPSQVHEHCSCESMRTADGELAI